MCIFNYFHLFLIQKVLLNFNLLQFYSNTFLDFIPKNNENNFSNFNNYDTRNQFIIKKPKKITLIEELRQKIQQLTNELNSEKQKNINLTNRINSYINAMNELNSKIKSLQLNLNSKNKEIQNIINIYNNKLKHSTSGFGNSKQGESKMNANIIPLITKPFIKFQIKILIML